MQVTKKLQLLSQAPADPYPTNSLLIAQIRNLLTLLDLNVEERVPRLNGSCGQVSSQAADMNGIELA